MITNIKIQNLYPHPKNPRKELGDLQELSDSIKANGVLQNLTVVPLDGGAYRVVIGHRRLAAAKLAGLTELPCTIVDMDERAQVATMLLENIQRSDLTVYEQAQGFQMMLDFGDSIAEIAARTGFSDTTVRNRVKLLELDQKMLKEASHQVSLTDLVELSRIDDIEERNKVLSKVGTRDFEWCRSAALRNQEAKKNAPLIKEELMSFATEIEASKSGKYQYVDVFYFSNWSKGKTVPLDAGEKKYFFTWSAASATLYTEKERKEAEKRPQEEIDLEKAVRDRENALKEVTQQAFEMRKAFIAAFAPKRYQAETILEWLCKAELYTSTFYTGFSNDSLMSIIGIENANMLSEQFEKKCKAYATKPLHTAAVTAWCRLGDNPANGYFRKNFGGRMPEHAINEKLNLTYIMLCAFGYEMSSVETALQDGTHELFDARNEKSTLAERS